MLTQGQPNECVKEQGETLCRCVETIAALQLSEGCIGLLGGGLLKGWYQPPVTWPKPAREGKQTCPHQSSLCASFLCVCWHARSCNFLKQMIWLLLLPRPTTLLLSSACLALSSV